MLFRSLIKSRLSSRTAFAGALMMCAATLGGCANDAQNGALLGGLIGTGAGAIIGHQTGEKWAGAGIGAAAGAATGYIIGNEMDKDPRRSHSSHPRYEY